MLCLYIFVFGCVGRLYVLLVWRSWLPKLEKRVFGLSQLAFSKGVVGIEFLDDGIVVTARGAGKNADSLSCAEFLSVDMESDNTPSSASKGVLAAPIAKSLLKSFVEKYKFEKRLCHVVLKPADYQLLLVDAPDVPDEEMREAIRWRIKDLISIPLPNAAIDIFNLPDDANRAGKRMLYVVVVDLAIVHHIMDVVKHAGLKLSSIDISELAMRNLTLFSEEERAIAIARIREGGGSVSIFRHGDLYLSRQFQLNYNAGLLDDLPDDVLALEIQRSLDYFERQMGQAPPAYIYMCGTNVSDDKITQNLRRGLNIPIKFFDLMQALSLNEDNQKQSMFDEGMLQLTIAALGALYRKEVG